MQGRKIMIYNITYVYNINIVSGNEFSWWPRRHPSTQRWENTSFYSPWVNGFSDGMSESLSSFGKLQARDIQKTFFFFFAS